eukprot:scpid70582/ scgid8868/ 
MYDDKKRVEVVGNVKTSKPQARDHRRVLWNVSNQHHSPYSPSPAADTAGLTDPDQCCTQSHGSPSELPGNVTNVSSLQLTEPDQRPACTQPYEEAVQAGQQLSTADQHDEYEACSILVRNIPQDKTRSDVESYFSEIGEVRRGCSTMFVNPATDKFTGVADVVFKSWASALQVLSCQYLLMRPSVISVEPAEVAGYDRYEHARRTCGNRTLPPLPIQLRRVNLRGSPLHRIMPVTENGEELQVLSYFSRMTCAEFDDAYSLSQMVDGLVRDDGSEE